MRRSEVLYDPLPAPAYSAICTAVAPEAVRTRGLNTTTADATIAVLEDVIAETGRWPANIRMDNGPELTAHAMRGLVPLLADRHRVHRTGLTVADRLLRIVQRPVP